MRRFVQRSPRSRIAKAPGAAASERLQIADIPALAHHYRRSYRRLHREALAIVGSPEIAEEIVQEAFANTAAAIQRGSRIAHLGGWLKRCVRNLSISQIERKASLQLDEQHIHLPSPELTPVEAVHAQACCHELLRAIADLPPTQRRALLLFELHGLRYEEIASSLDRSVEAVRQLVFRARCRVRDAVGPDAIHITVPVAWLKTDAVASPDSPLRRFVNYISAKLGDVQTFVVGHSVEVASHPTAAMISAALVVAALSAPASTDPTPTTSTAASHGLGLLRDDGGALSDVAGARESRRLPTSAASTRGSTPRRVAPPATGDLARPPRPGGQEAMPAYAESGDAGGHGSSTAHTDQKQATDGSTGTGPGGVCYGGPGDGGGNCSMRTDADSPLETTIDAAATREDMLPDEISTYGGSQTAQSSAPTSISSSGVDDETVGIVGTGAGRPTKVPRASTAGRVPSAGHQR